MSSQRLLPSLGVAVSTAVVFAVLVSACVPHPPGRPTPQPPATAPPTSAPPATVSAASPSPSQTFSRPTLTPQPSFLTYRVRTGDTITKIAKDHGTTERSIGYWNREKYPSLDPESSKYNPNNIRVGWRLLIIPNVEVHPDRAPDPPPSPTATTPPSGTPAASEEPTE